MKHLIYEEFRFRDSYVKVSSLDICRCFLIFCVVGEGSYKEKGTDYLYRETFERNNGRNVGDSSRGRPLKNLKYRTFITSRMETTQQHKLTTKTYKYYLYIKKLYS
jgi:hypothetical protein